MAAIKAIFLQHLRGQFRNKYSIFWALIFPLVLMTILILILGGMEGGDFTLDIGLAASPDAAFDTYPGIVTSVFRGIESDEDGWINVTWPEPGQALDDFLAAERSALENGDRHAVLFVPAGSPPQPAEFQVFRRPENQLSLIAVDVIQAIMGEINKQINFITGGVERADLVAVNNYELEIGTAEAEEEGFSMGAFLVPGIILLTFLSSGLQILVEEVASLRFRGILKRYFATPLQAGQFFAGTIAYIILLTAVQLLVIYGWGRFIFGIELPIFRLSALAYLIYALLVSLSFGFIVLAVIKSKESVGMVTQGLIYPMAFLGGVFFPVTEMPGLIKIIVMINPMTYLVNGLRDILDVYPSPTAGYLNLIVPGVWLFIGLIVSVKFFRWNPDGDL